MASQNTRIRFYASVAVGAVILSLVNVYATRVLDAAGVPLVFVAALVLEFIFIIIAIYAALEALRGPLTAGASVLRSAWQGALANAHIIQLRDGDGALARGAKQIIRLEEDYGARLLAGVAVAIVALIAFANLLFQVIHHTGIAQIDTRVANVIPTIRTPFQTTLFAFFTFLGNPESVILAVVLTSLALIIARQRWAAGIVVAGWLADLLSVFLLKHAVHRVRPDISLQLLHGASFSFPSGHAMAATVVYGLLTYFLLKLLKRPWQRMIVLVGYILTAFMIGISRVYFDVHFLSDVTASFFFGTMLLAILVTVYEIAPKLWPGLHRHLSTEFHARWLIAVPLLLMIWSAALSPVIIRPQIVSPDIKSIVLNPIDNTTTDELPAYSETLHGSRMEPINFILVGSQNELERTYLEHGWYKADAPTANNTLKAIALGFQYRQYLNAPVTPSYLEGKPETIAFEQATQSNTVRQRHHTRLWQTDFVTAGGRRIWVGTASYDSGVQYITALHLPTHRIDPDIDRERAYITKSLKLNPTFLHITEPELGHNASGDSFFTDGRAVFAEVPTL